MGAKDRREGEREGEDDIYKHKIHSSNHPSQVSRLLLTDGI